MEPNRSTGYLREVASWLTGYSCYDQRFCAQCAPYMKSVCVLKTDCPERKNEELYGSGFLQEAEAIQRNCLNSKKWTGINLFYIGGRKCGYAG